jgi:hypothetical protein
MTTRPEAVTIRRAAVTTQPAATATKPEAAHPADLTPAAAWSRRVPLRPASTT